MRDTIKGAIIGAFVAAGISVLLAQTTPSWTSPRTWATDDLLTAAQFNAQIRDNLLNIRGYAACAENGTTGTSSAGTILYGDCRWAAGADTFDIHDVVTTPATIVDADLVPFSDEGTAGDPMRHTTAANFAAYVLPDDGVTQAKMANNAVGAPQLKIGTLNQSGNGWFTLPGNGLSFGPVPGGTADVDNASRIYLTYSFESGRSIYGMVRWRVNDGTDDGGGSPSGLASTIKYITSSDDPSLWVVLDAAGAMVGMWEAEDPISAGDTVAPLSVPTDELDVALVGHTVVNVGLPTLSVINAVYTSDLTADQRTAAQDALDAYLIQRGWLTGPHTHSTIAADYAAVVVRYQPSVIQWAMRCAANAAIGVSGCKDAPVTAFYQDNLVVSSGAWAIP